MSDLSVTNRRHNGNKKKTGNINKLYLSDNYFGDKEIGKQLMCT